MKGIIYLQNDWGFKYNLNWDDMYGYSITINTDLNEDFLSLAYNQVEFEESIQFNIDFFENEDTEYAKTNINFLEKNKNNLENLLKNAEYICFDFDYPTIVKYINNNPCLNDKKILIYSLELFNKEELKKIHNVFDGKLNNVYFKLSDNTDLISYNEYLDTINALDNMAAEIKKFNFSPLEKIMFAYDLVRNRVYLDADKNEEKNTSRDLTSSLLGDKIVCIGFARIFYSLLEMLNIESNIFLLFGKKSGHARNEIYVKDDKYGVDGVYYFDPTWDCKKAETDNSYLLSYKYFAKTYNEMKVFDNNRLIPQKFSNFTVLLPFILENEFNKDFKDMNTDLIRTINYMYRVVNKKILVDPIKLNPIAPSYGEINKKKVLKETFNLINKFNTHLSADTLLKLLFNVRKQLYYQDNTKYPFNIDDFKKTFINSNWKHEDNSVDFFSSFLGDKDVDNSDGFDNYYNNLGKNIECVKLTKTLKKIHINKN